MHNHPTHGFPLTIGKTYIYIIHITRSYRLFFSVPFSVPLIQQQQQQQQQHKQHQQFTHNQSTYTTDNNNNNNMTLTAAYPARVFRAVAFTSPVRTTSSSFTTLLCIHYSYGYVS